MTTKKAKPVKNVIFWMAAGAIIILLWSLLQAPAMVNSEIKFSQFLKDVQDGKVAEVQITGTQIKGTYKADQSQFKTNIPQQYNDLVKLLEDNKVGIDVKDANKTPWFSVLFSWFPIVRSLVMSVQETNLVSMPTFVGLDNFANVLADPLFGKAVSTTASANSTLYPAAAVRAPSS